MSSVLKINITYLCWYTTCPQMSVSSLCMSVILLTSWFSFYGHIVYNAILFFSNQSSSKGANRIKIRWRRVFMLPCWRNSSRKQGHCWGVSPPFEFQGTGSESSLIDAMVLMVKLICWCEVALYITLRYAIPFPVGRTSCLSCLAYSSLFERTKSYCVPSLLGMPYRLKSRPSPWQGP